MVKIKAKHAFVHDGHDLNRGEEAQVSAALAADLHKRGLVHDLEALKAIDAPQSEPESKKAPEPKNKKAAEPSNKAASKK